MKVNLTSSFFGIILILIRLNVCAQTTSLYGKITFNNIPEPFVNVFINDLSIGTSSTIEGIYFIADIPLGTSIVEVSAIGFMSQKHELTFKEGVPINLDFTLEVANDRLNEIVISGTLVPVSKLESPVAVEVYTKRFFKRNPTPSIFESLQNINGIRPQLNCNVCNTGDIHINGLEGPYTFVLIDGMPIVSGLSTVYGLTGIPQSLIERVEIVKGPASTLYGSEAVGGIINIITKQPGNATKFSLDSYGSSWGEQNTDLGISYKLGKRNKGLLGVNHFIYQNPIDNNKDGFTDLTLQNRISVFNKIEFERPDHRTFNLAARYIYEDRWGGEMGWQPMHRGGDDVYAESIYTNRWEAFGTYRLPVVADINFQFSGNAHSQNSFYGLTSYNANQYIGFAQLSWNAQFSNMHSLLLGSAYRYTYYDDNTFATLSIDGTGNEPSIMHLPGVFLQDEISLSQRQKLLLGVRYDYNSLHGNVITPRANYKWNSFDKKNTIRISVGNGFRVANVFTEDHAALTGSRTVEFEDALNPETSWNGNINYVKNVILKEAILTLDGSVFYTHFSNRILPDYETDPNKIIYSNLSGSSVSKGISLNGDLMLENGLIVLVGATLMDVSVMEEGTKRRQLLTERFSGVWNMTYRFNKIGITLDYTGNFYGPMRLPLLGELDPRDEYSPWFSIQNIQMTKRLGKYFELFTGVKNLLNFTPAANSIARSFDPFDKKVQFDTNDQVIPVTDNPYALTFDPSYVYASNQGIRIFIGLNFTIH
jgi:outer membrane receptor for ferrienterochelin and colicins